jgi:hypothetical protein
MNQSECKKCKKCKNDKEFIRPQKKSSMNYVHLVEVSLSEMKSGTRSKKW